jgi:ribosomal protein L3
VTVRNLRVLESNPATGILLIEGAVPGARSGLLAIKRVRQAEKAEKGEKAEKKKD